MSLDVQFHEIEGMTRVWSKEISDIINFKTLNTGLKLILNHLMECLEDLSGFRLVFS